MSAIDTCGQLHGVALAKGQRFGREKRGERPARHPVSSGGLRLTSDADEVLESPVEDCQNESVEVKACTAARGQMTSLISFARGVLIALVCVVLVLIFGNRH